MESFQKIIHLPVAIMVKPNLLGRKYPIKLRNYEAFIHFPAKNDVVAVGIQAPHLPPKPYFEGVLDKMDKYDSPDRTYWGSNDRIRGGKVIESDINALILTVKHESSTVDEAREVLRYLEGYLLQWFGDFNSWIELLSQQDLSVGSAEANVSSSQFSQGLWSVKTEKKWRNAGPDTINLTINLKSNESAVDDKDLLIAIDKANAGTGIGFENTLLLDGRRRHNRGEFNSSCMFFGQYIEAITRKRLRQYLDNKSTDLHITNAFLEKKALDALFNNCKALGVETYLSNSNRSEVCKIRNIAAHARNPLTHHYSVEMFEYAGKVFDGVGY